MHKVYSPVAYTLHTGHTSVCIYIATGTHSLCVHLQPSQPPQSGSHQWESCPLLRAAGRVALAHIPQKKRGEEDGGGGGMSEAARSGLCVCVYKKEIRG